jgi:hypothetical protein
MIWRRVVPYLRTSCRPRWMKHIPQPKKHMTTLTWFRWGPIYCEFYHLENATAVVSFLANQPPTTAGCFVLGQPPAHEGHVTFEPQSMQWVQIIPCYPRESTTCLKCTNCFPWVNQGEPKKIWKGFFIKIICVANLTSTNPMPTKATRDLAVCLPAPRSLDCAGGADVVCETTCRTNVGVFRILKCNCLAVLLRTWNWWRCRFLSHTSKSEVSCKIPAWSLPRRIQVPKRHRSCPGQFKASLSWLSGAVPRKQRRPFRFGTHVHIRGNHWRVVYGPLCRWYDLAHCNHQVLNGARPWWKLDQSVVSRTSETSSRYGRPFNQSSLKVTCDTKVFSIDNRDWRWGKTAGDFEGAGLKLSNWKKFSKEYWFRVFYI